MTIIIWNLKKEKEKLKNFWQLVNCKPTFFTNWNVIGRLEFAHYAFSINQMSDICEVWKYEQLKDGFRSISQKLFQGRHFVVGGTRNFKLLSDISFDSGFQKIILSSLQLFLCACYLGDIQWNKVATSMARNFNNIWLLYLHLSNMLNLCPNIWFIKNSECQQLLFWRKSS